MSDYQAVKDPVYDITYRIRQWRRKDDEPVYYDQDGQLYITVFNEDLREAALSEKEINECREEAGRAGHKALPLEHYISRRRQRKAGIRKFRSLAKENQLPVRGDPVQQQPSISVASTSTASVEQPDIHLDQTEQLEDPVKPEDTTQQDESSHTSDQDETIEDTSSTSSSSSENSQGSVAKMSVPVAINRHINDVKIEIAAMYNQITEHNNNRTRMTLSDAEVCLQRANELAADYENIRKDVRNLDPAIDVSSTQSTMAVLRLSINQVIAGSKTIIKDLTPAPPPVVTPSSSRATDLPKLSLPRFNGDWKEWLSFRDTFKSRVYDRPETEVSKIDKLHHLRKALEGDALLTIQSIQVVEANLERAWKTLCEKYDNDQKNTDKYLVELENLRPMTEASASQLRILYDKVNGAREALKIIGEEVDKWDTFLVGKVKRCFDRETLQYFENMRLNSSQGSSQAKITWEKLSEFVTSRCLVLDSFKPSQKEGHKHQKDHQKDHPRPKATTSSNSAQLTKRKYPCPICKSTAHGINQCQKYRSYGLQQKNDAVRAKRLCYNCLSPTHVAGKCPSTNRCTECGEKHHSSLHEPQEDDEDQQGSKSSSSSGSTAKKDVTSNHSHREESVLLPTAEIIVKDVTGKNTRLRAMLDTGSQATFITERAAQLLGLRRRSASCNLKGIGNSAAGQPKGEVDLIIRSCQNENFEAKAPALILPMVTSIQPGTLASHSKWEHLRGLSLADPSYYRPGKIDVILGADISLQAFLGEQKKGDPGMSTAHSTVFGSVVAGAAIDNPKSITANSVMVTSEPTLSDLLQRFWAIEEVDQSLC